MNIMYLRKSRSDMALEEFDKIDVLKRHKEILINISKKNNDIIDMIFEEIVSGETIKDRPEMQKVLALLETGTVDKCYAIEIERLSRGDGEDQAKILKAFKYSNTKIITPAKLYDLTNEFDENYFEFGTFMSRQEWKTIRRRLQSGMAKSAQEGKFIGSNPPFGYSKIKLKNEKGWKLIPNEDSEIIRNIFTMFVNDNLQLTEICRKLKEMNIKTQRNNFFTYFTLKVLLKNPAYIGKIGFQKCKTYRNLENGIEIKKRESFNTDYILYDGIHEAIVPLDLWNKANEKLKSNSTPCTKKNLELKNPFAGILYCSNCKKVLNLSSFVKNKYRYLGCDTMDCKTYKSQIEKVEQRVVDMLRNNLKDYKNYINNYEHEFVKEEINIDKISDKLDKDLNKLKIQLTKACEMLEIGAYTLELFKNRQKDINDQIEILNNKKKNIDENNLYAKVINYRMSVPIIENVLDNYALLSVKEKNKLLKTIVDKIYYTREKSNHKTLKNEEDFTLQIDMKI